MHNSLQKGREQERLTKLGSLHPQAVVIAKIVLNKGQLQTPSAITNFGHFTSRNSLHVCNSNRLAGDTALLPIE